jgi:lysozyme family protein
MADFLKAYRKTVGYEGSTLDLDSNDSGNWTSGKIGVGELSGTKYGITPIDYKKFYGKQPTRNDMDALTEARAQAIFKSLYWDPIHGDDINVQHFAEQIFDVNVNTGGGSVPIIVGQALGIALQNKVGLNEDTIYILNKLANEEA